MNSNEMMQRFRQFATASLLFTPSRIRQFSQVLFESELMRIVMTRYEGNIGDVEVDVEVCLPSLPKSHDIVVFQRFIDITIETLEYLKRLGSIGFGLELLQEEGFFVASGNLSPDPEKHVFEVLKPPNRIISYNLETLD